MAIGKKPSLNKVKEINLDSPEVQNFINSGVIGTAAEKIVKLKQPTLQKK